MEENRTSFANANITNMIPNEWPKAKGNYLLPVQAPYLKELITKAKENGYTKEEMLSAWCELLNMKSKQALKPTEQELDLAQAMYLFFYDKSYYETKQHYAALLCFVR